MISGTSCDLYQDINQAKDTLNNIQTEGCLNEKNIYRFGTCFNSVQLGDGNITNIIIKSRYTLLDKASHTHEIELLLQIL